MLVVVTLACLSLASVWGEGNMLEEISQLKRLLEMAASPVDMEAAISKVEALIKDADQTPPIITPLDESEEKYMNTIQVLDDIIEAVQDPTDAEVFLKAKGLTRIVAPNINTENSEMKTKLIILLKVLFDVAPAITKAYIPTNILQTLLETFENDSVALKAHSLDVLALWIPGNPKIQTRVMRLKGLEPFYNQVEKLDVSAIQVLLNLFNKILQEHLDVRDKNEKGKMEPEIYNMYRRIGLVESLSTKRVCIGFLNIFEILWGYSNDVNHDVIVTAYELIKNLKPCMILYTRNKKAHSLFERLLKYIQDETRKDYFDKLELNTTDFVDIINNGMNNMTFHKDEL